MDIYSLFMYYITLRKFMLIFPQNVRALVGICGILEQIPTIGRSYTMHTFSEITPQQLDGNLFRMIGEQWMLIGAQQDDKVNMMTASWGGAGILWGKPVVFAFIRPQRYTKELVDASNGFSCTFFSQEYRPQLALCGSKSGREIDKVEASGFHVLNDGGVPYFDEAQIAILCQKLYHQPMDPACFVTSNLAIDHYPNKDYHHFYVAEIRKILIQDA